jgi:Zn-dependent protease with chaperone function
VTYFLYGVTLALGWFVSISVLTCSLVSICAGQVSNMTREAAPATRARVLFTLRLLPSLIGITFIAAIFLPSFIRFEPRDFDEAFGLTTSSLAILACAAITAALKRGVSAVASVRARVAACLKHASPMSMGTLRAFRVDARMATMTLVGVLRPRLLVTRPLLDLLTPEELAAAVAHERGHLRSWDNLKRLAMRCAPDIVFWSRTSRHLEQEWSIAAEHAADARAARDTSTRLALASALIKVARFSPVDFAGILASPLVGGQSLRSRIERLVDPPRSRSSWPTVPPDALTNRALFGWALAAALFCLGASFGYEPALATVHEITEIVVHRVP